MTGLSIGPKYSGHYDCKPFYTFIYLYVRVEVDDRVVLDKDSYLVRFLRNSQKVNDK